MLVLIHIIQKVEYLEMSYIHVNKKRTRMICPHVKLNYFNKSCVQLDFIRGLLLTFTEDFLFTFMLYDQNLQINGFETSSMKIVSEYRKKNS